MEKKGEHRNGEKKKEDEEDVMTKEEFMRKRNERLQKKKLVPMVIYVLVLRYASTSCGLHTPLHTP